MSGQCLSADVPDQPLSPGTRRSLGGPLPHQLAGREQTDPRARGPKVPRLLPQPDAWPWSYRELAALSSRYAHLAGTLSTRYSPFRHFTRGF